VATQVLLTGQVVPAELLGLAYKELTARGAIVLQRVPRRGLLPRSTRLTYDRSVALPHRELWHLHQSLLHNVPSGTKARAATRQVRRSDPTLNDAIIDFALGDLVTKRFADVTADRRVLITTDGAALRTSLLSWFDRKDGQAPLAVQLLTPARRAVSDDGSGAVWNDVAYFDSFDCASDGGWGGDGGADCGDGGGGGD
jgi:hypothetical protein